MKNLKIFLSLLTVTTVLMAIQAVTPAAESYPPGPMHAVVLAAQRFG